MLIAIITILVLIAIVYRKDVIYKAVPGKPVWYPYRRIFALLILSVVPVVLVNQLFPARREHSTESLIEQSKNSGNKELIISTYSDLAKLYPDSLEIRMQLIDYQVEYGGFHFEDFDFSKDTKSTSYLLQTYAEITSDSKSIRINRLDSIPKDIAFSNYIKALAYRSSRSSEKTVLHYLEREVLKHPESERGWEFLWTIYSIDHPVQLNKLMQNGQARKFIPHTYQNYYYFSTYQWDFYFLNILESRIYGVTLITFLSAFLVSFVWLVFLRSMDIFNREKWSHILIVFLLGALFTYLCLPIYDYASIVLDFKINGSAWNDFLYCVAVIGGGEELVKLIPWILFGIFSRRLKEPFDYILYASATALGFAFTENLMYLENSGSIVNRCILSTVSHMFDASVVAYACILARYKFRNIFMKIITPVLGYVAACVFHGFYDFWLISPAAEGYHFVTIVFFVISLHAWFYFKNNAINNSDYFLNATTFNAAYQQDLLTFSMVGMLMVEYVFISAQNGSWAGNAIIYSRSFTIGIFLLYISFILSKIQLRKGEWTRWKFRIPNITGKYFKLPMSYDEDPGDHIGLNLKLFAPKSNPYIGDKLPKSGVIIQQITVSDDPEWYIFQLNTPVIYNNYVPSHVIIKNKLPNESLTQPKIEIYFMFIPDINLLQKERVDIRQLRYAGRAYSIPL